MKQTSNDGSYTLEYRKEEGSAFAKGTLYLDSCTQIRKGIKGRMYGFELHIQDKIYGLAADSLNEMDTWIKALCRATGIEIEQEKPSSSLLSGRHNKNKQHKNMRESLRNSSHPLLQEYGKESDQLNWKNRQENRLKSLIKVFISQLVSRARDKKEVAKEANLNLALFIKDCLTHMDRGYVFRIINYVKDQYKQVGKLQVFMKSRNFIRSRDILIDPSF